MRSPILKFLRWPIWVAALATGAKSFADNPIIGSRRLNAMGLHRTRVRLAHAITGWRRRRVAKGLTAQDRAAFDRQGYIEWRDVLPPETFQRLRDALFGQSWTAREATQGDTVTRRIAVDDAMLRSVPELGALLRSPRWRGMMRYAAGSRAEPLYYIQTIFPNRSGDAADPQTNFHSDAFHPSMKAWLFLTDVAAEDGALTYVPGSHRLTAARLDWEHDRALAAADELDQLSARGSLRVGREELAVLGLPEPHAFAVPANTLIVADMFGFHARGVASRPGVRVELWAYGRRNPFLPWTGLHLGSLPGLARRRIALIWKLQDRFPKLFGPPWTPVGEKRPDAP